MPFLSFPSSSFPSPLPVRPSRLFLLFFFPFPKQNLTCETPYTTKRQSINQFPVPPPTRRHLTHRHCIVVYQDVPCCHLQLFDWRLGPVPAWVYWLLTEWPTAAGSILTADIVPSLPTTRICPGALAQVQRRGPSLPPYLHSPQQSSTQIKLGKTPGRVSLSTYPLTYLPTYLYLHTCLDSKDI